MTVNYETVGTHIRYFRTKHKVTQEELAFRIGSSAAYVSYLENGKKKPSLHKLIQISEALNVTVNDIIYGPVNNPVSRSSNEINNLLSNYSSEKRMILIDNISAILQTIST